MTIKVPNPEVLRAGVEHAELDLNHWDQGAWVKRYEDGSCGTTACLAGHILLAQGWDWNQLQANSTHIAPLAMKALGFGSYDDRWYYRDSGVSTWEPTDANRFYREIFGMVREGIDNFSMNVPGDGSYEKAQRLARDPAPFKIFKERITELTGIDL